MTSSAGRPLADARGSETRFRAATVRSRGFTLLEMLVATAIMGIAVVGLLSNISTSLQHASRMTEYERATLAAQRKMDELLLNPRLPYDAPMEGVFDPAATGMEGGWRARLTRFERPPVATPGAPLLERLELEVWWTSGLRKRSLSLEAFRRGIIPLPLPGGVGLP